ncbi:MAG: hypothetical protein K0S08_783 [Gammaproteobacteria bacterium]|jgi:membrane fusion protein (multidrug efflux system)|nr:hypothetical protein [Gammaproteobacteria bacterium]
MLNRLNRKLKIALGLVLLCLIYLSADWWFLYSNDAYLYSDVVEVSSQVSGFIKQVFVKDNQSVKQGELLMQIDEAPFILKVHQDNAALEEAQHQLSVLIAKKIQSSAELEAAQAQHNLANANLKRYQSLVKTGAISKQYFEQINTQQQISSAQIKVDQAEIDQATKAVLLQQSTIKAMQNQLALSEYNLSQTKIYAANSGHINHLEVFKGDYVTPGKTLFGLVSQNAWQVIANYESNHISHIHTGDRVFIYIAGHPFHIFLGHVESIGRAVSRDQVAPNAALPYIEPVTSWIRYPYRFPVRIKLDQLPKDFSLYMGTDARTFVL